MAQDLNGITRNTVQSQIDDQNLWLGPDSGIGILPLLVRAGELIPAYWSRARDQELARYALKVDHVSSAFSMFISKFASIPVRIVPRDASIKAHVKQAADLTANINEMSNFGKGWTSSLAPQMLFSYITQDNGMTAEIIGDGKPDQERRGFYGLAFLDPSKVQRTSNPTYPIIYWDIGPGGTGNRYKMHYTRVMTAASMPSTYARLNGIGFCALSRLINTAQHLLDLSTTEQEELGSRPKRRLIIGKKGITVNEIANAFMLADKQMDNEGLSRYSKSVVIAATTKPTQANEIDIDIKDLAGVIQGDDKERSITLGMFLIALALNIPPRWLWPATSTGATKADAAYQHIAGMGGGIGHLLQVFINMLGGTPLSDMLGKPIPSHLEVVFDNQDDEQDAQEADMRKVRSEYWTNNLTSGLIDVRVGRLQMLEAGDLTEQEFDDLELAEGRLPDGTDVVNLFMSTDPDIREMLSISVGDVLNVEANDRENVLPAIEDKLIEVRAILQNPPRPAVFDKAKQAYAALVALKELYTQPTMIEQQQGLAEIQQNEQQTTPEQGATEDSKPVKPEADQANQTQSEGEKVKEH